MTQEQVKEDAPAQSPAPEQSNAVAESPQAGLPVKFEDRFATYAGKGLEKLSAQDMVVPYLLLLQDLSPQVKKHEAAYVEGAESGAMLNNITNRLYKNETGGVDIIPVYWDKWFTEWKVTPKENGKRDEEFVQRHGSEIMSQVQRINGDDTLPNGNIIKTSAVYYVMILDGNGGLIPAIVAMRSTNMKVSKKLATFLNTLTRKTSTGVPYTPPAFASVVNLKSVMERDEKNSWFIWKPEWKGFTDQLFAGEVANYYFDQCESFYKSVIRGAVKVTEAPETAQATAAASPPPAEGGASENDEIPF